MVAVRGLRQVQRHLHRHTQHTSKLIPLTAEQTPNVVVCLHVGKQQVVETAHHFGARACTGLRHQSLHVIRHLLVVAQHQLVEQGVVGHAVVVVCACKQSVVDILVGG